MGQFLMNLTPEQVAEIEEITRQVINTEVSKWATKLRMPDLQYEPGQVPMFNETHHRLMPSSTAGGGGHILQDSGTSMTERTYADFQDGFTLTDDSAGDATEIDLDYAGTGDIANVAGTEAAGTATTVPRGDHVHAIAFGTVSPTLDECYDADGVAGSDRTIIADTGAVNLEYSALDTTHVLEVRKTGDTQPTFNVESSGDLEWGAGGASASDVTLRRDAASSLTVSTPAGAAATVKVNNIRGQTTSTARVTFPEGVIINGGLNLDTATAAIAANVLTVTQPHMLVTGTGTINTLAMDATISGIEGDVFYISPNAGGITVTIADAADNIVCIPTGNITLDAIGETAQVIRKGSVFYAFMLGGGGASGSVATDTIWDAAGDLAVGTGADTAARLAIGAANTVLVSNGTTASWDPAPQLANIQDTSGNTRITTAASAYHVTLTGDSRITGSGASTTAGALDFNSTTAPFYGITMAQALAGAEYIGINITPTLTTSANSATATGVNGLAQMSVNGHTGTTLSGLNFISRVAGASGQTASTTTSMFAVKGTADARIVAGATTTIGITTQTGLYGIASWNVITTGGAATATINTTTARGGNIAAPTVSTSGAGTEVIAVTTYVGLDIDAVAISSAAATFTNAFGLRVGDITGTSFTAANNRVVQFGTATPTTTSGLFEMLANFSAAANQTPIYISEGATPTRRQLRTKDGGAIGAGDLVCVLV